ncbi:hypothetical protein VDF90_21075 [Xanthomonas campestris pv. raphani]|uniref:hypothetical protein n=1 Tax=Xanthomonas TaxID=338 RepID=UPI0016010692|nr:MULTISPECIES: hypothetical protein [Xanthomonas]MCC5072847.1 hypothetical protein [Xanthomonas campestris pv. plantaginis]MEA0735414.1 hypothetical protein [Xanthomonas campestris pv. campestris]MEA9789692.1 hypothetical protein [Xanthomonas campestris pv. raphani]
MQATESLYVAALPHLQRRCEIAASKHMHWRNSQFTSRAWQIFYGRTELSRSMNHGDEQ